ncbi:MAG: hypothetical protein ACF8OB_08455 [Phycisphaeraceae bacterium JB051]
MQTMFAMIACLFLATNTVSAENYFRWEIDALKPNTGIADLSPTLDRPAGKQGYLQTQGEDLILPNGKAMRLWGTNLLYGSTMLSHSETDKLAKRLASLGFNCIRIHHADAPHEMGGFFLAKSRTINQPVTNPWELDTRRLDALFYFIHALKQQGIYTALSLSSYHEVISKNNLPKHRLKQHPYPIIVASEEDEYFQPYCLFDPGMIKQYSTFLQTILLKPNPYTGLTLAQDPCIAFIEINNEKGLHRHWGLSPNMPEKYKRVYEEKWQTYLRDQYQTTSNLANAWQGNHKQPQHQKHITTQTNASIQKQWIATKNTTLINTQWRDGPAARWVHILRVTAKQNDQAITNKLTFELSQGQAVQFQAFAWATSAAQPRPIAITIRDQNNRAVSQTQRIAINANPQTYVVKLNINKDCKHPVLCIEQLQSSTTYQLGDLEIISLNHLAINANIDFKQVPKPYQTELSQYGPTAQRDGYLFKIALEKEYFAHFKQLFKEQFHIKYPVVGTQDTLKASWLTNQDMDMTDCHAYYSHNEPGILYGSPNIAKSLMPAGRPRLLTEFNHLGQYAPVDRMTLDAIGGSFQGYSGLFQFAYCHGYWQTRRVPRHWNMRYNPAALVSSVLGSLIFRNQLIAPNASTRYEHLTSEHFANALIQTNGNPDKVDAQALFGMNKDQFLTQPIRLNINSNAVKKNEPTQAAHQSSLSLSIKQADHPILKINGPMLQGFIGNPSVNPIQTDQLTFNIKPNALEYVSVFAISRDQLPIESSKKILLIAVGDQKVPQSINDLPIDKKYTVTESITGHIHIKTNKRIVNQYALDAYGQRTHRVQQMIKPDTVRTPEHTYSLQLTTQAKTLWYELELMD